MRCYGCEANEKIIRILRQAKIDDFFYRMNQQLVFSSETFNYLRIHRDRLHRSIQAMLDRVEPITFNPRQLQSTEYRIHYTLASGLQDPPPSNVMDEMVLRMLIHQDYSVEYLGRGIKLETLPLADRVQTFAFDVLGGQRKYFWAKRPLSYRPSDQSVQETFAQLKNWLDDPEARVVLSLGGGGVRMASIPTVLKIINLLHSRDQIREVWGCSGGAIMGYLYALGVEPRWIEQLAYDFYNERFAPVSLKRSLLVTMTSLIRNQVHNLIHPGQGYRDLRNLFVHVVEELKGKSDPLHEEIPFFALATNFEQAKAFALTDPKYVSKSCEDLFIASDPLRAVITSSAIPFVFPTEDFFVASGRRRFTDGGIAEEIPLLLPYLKWRRERQASPQETTKKLKIFYVDLGLRMSEIRMFRQLRTSIPFLKETSSSPSILDIAIESRHERLVQVLKIMPDVEVLGVRLTLNELAVLDVKKIPRVVQKGRICFLQQLSKLNQELSETRRSSDQVDRKSQFMPVELEKTEA